MDQQTFKTILEENQEITEDNLEIKQELVKLELEEQEKNEVVKEKEWKRCKFCIEQTQEEGVIMSNKDKFPFQTKSGTFEFSFESRETITDKNINLSVTVTNVDNVVPNFGVNVNIENSTVAVIESEYNFPLENIDVRNSSVVIYSSCNKVYVKNSHNVYVGNQTSNVTIEDSNKIFIDKECENISLEENENVSISEECGSKRGEICIGSGSENIFLGIKCASIDSKIIIGKNCGIGGEIIFENMSVLVKSSLYMGNSCANDGEIRVFGGVEGNLSIDDNIENSFITE